RTAACRGPPESAALAARCISRKGLSVHGEQGGSGEVGGGTVSAPKPYSPETLAERWGCSAEKVRIMYRNGELPGFRLGKLIRIPAAEVERYECQTTSTDSLGTEADGLSHGTTPPDELRRESRLARLTGAKPKSSHALSSCELPPQ